MAPTPEPTNQPTNHPTSAPSNHPTPQPTQQPTNPPTEQPTSPPTEHPTNPPTGEPTPQPTDQPSKRPTEQPSKEPTDQPTPIPTEMPQETRHLKNRNDVSEIRGCLYCGNPTVPCINPKKSVLSRGISGFLECTDLFGPCVWEGEEMPSSRELTLMLLDDEYYDGVFVVFMLGSHQQKPSDESLVHVFCDSALASTNGFSERSSLSESLILGGGAGNLGNQLLVGPFSRSNLPIEVCFEFTTMQNVDRLRVLNAEDVLDVDDLLGRVQNTELCISIVTSESSVDSQPQSFSQANNAETDQEKTADTSEYPSEGGIDKEVEFDESLESTGGLLIHALVIACFGLVIWMVHCARKWF
ncbi:fibrinogen [Seminavis robusta]|uniref:Fibrinogen n=1 Tax=Seminavis robusta TaxID=568900 RepID=A0A9N8F083_9STRA|nr:fibrinogen [Seminavis robusta]|eukprot:Sro2182_g318020.1 fibrinogen (356) ;mRNA; r:10166-11233